MNVLNPGKRNSEDVGDDELQTATTYQVEVKVLNQSWPLSLEECKALLYYKEHWPDTQLSLPSHSSGDGGMSVLSLLKCAALCTSHHLMENKILDFKPMRFYSTFTKNIIIYYLTINPTRLCLGNKVVLVVSLNLKMA